MGQYFMSSVSGIWRSTSFDIRVRKGKEEDLLEVSLLLANEFYGWCLDCLFPACGCGPGYIPRGWKDGFLIPKLDPTLGFASTYKLFA